MPPSPASHWSLVIGHWSFRGLLAAVALVVTEAAAAASTQLHRDDSGAWRLLRDGKPFEIRGVGRETNLDLAAAIGANTIRTYDSQADPAVLAENRRRMDAALALGLVYIRGLNVRRESDRFSYANPDDLAAQRERIRQSVRAYRDHPGVLLWDLGNEAEGPRSSRIHPEFWRELDTLARIVKEEDPARPVMTTIAGPGRWRLQAVLAHYPSIDILGVNTYGQAVELPDRLAAAGWEKPFVLTEFGPRGHWEVEKTAWDAPIEPASEDKAALYAASYLAVKADPARRCLGAVCFVWAQKQEITSTWYGMFLETGEKTPAVDRIAEVYGGRPPANRSPAIRSLVSPLALKVVAPGQTFEARVEADDPEGDPLAYEWKVAREKSGPWAEGGHEEAPPLVEGCVTAPDPARGVAEVRAPAEPGAYRLFVYVRDGRGNGATQNLPFFVAPRM